MKRPVLVWDLPTRIFHWSLVASFVIVWLTAERERWRDIHVFAGYILLGVIVFRVVWGFFGSRYARFSQFLRGWDAVSRYMAGVIRHVPQRYVGHNPVGALAIMALIVLGLASSLSGWVLYDEAGGEWEEWLEEFHEWLSYAMLMVVVVHVLGVLFASWIHRENLVWAMITGRKQGLPEEAIGSPRRLVATLLILGLTASCGYAGYRIWENRADKTIEPSGPD